MKSEINEPSSGILSLTDVTITLSKLKRRDAVVYM